MLNSKRNKKMKPQIKKYLLLLVAILVATVALYAQAKVQQQKPMQKQEQSAVVQSGEANGEAAMMDCCKKGAKGEGEMKDMMKMCHSMMGNMEKSAEHPAGCSMMGAKEAKPANKEKVNE
jgi:hypothetical protein